MDLFTKVAAANGRFKQVKTFTTLVVGTSALLLMSIICVSYYQYQSPQYLTYSPPFVLFSNEANPHSSSSSSSSSGAQPHQHVFYLKTHKTGSTTMFFILAEYCRAHDLLPLLPRYQAIHINQKPPLIASQLFLARHVGKYDMVFNHFVYDPIIFSFLHADTFAVTTLREPFNNFVSAFLYYKKKWGTAYLQRVPGDDSITTFLENTTKYEQDPYGSFTNNRQSVDLGYDVSKGFQDIDYIESFIDQTEKRFDLVMITEYFDESLIILKRALRWTTQDILYLSKNKGTYYSDDTKDPTRELARRQLHAKFSQPDIKLYNHFRIRFKQRMKKEPGLQEEVEEFRGILGQLRDFCQYFNAKMSKNLVIPAGKWTNGFYMSPYKCRWLNMEESRMTKYLQERQKTMFVDMK